MFFIVLMLFLQRLIAVVMWCQHFDRLKSWWSAERSVMTRIRSSWVLCARWNSLNSEIIQIRTYSNHSFLFYRMHPLVSIGHICLWFNAFSIHSVCHWCHCTLSVLDISFFRVFKNVMPVLCGVSVTYFKISFDQYYLCLGAGGSLTWESALKFTAYERRPRALSARLWFGSGSQGWK